MPDAQVAICTEKIVRSFKENQKSCDIYPLQHGTTKMGKGASNQRICLGEEICLDGESIFRVEAQLSEQKMADHNLRVFFGFGESDFRKP